MAVCFNERRMEALEGRKEDSMIVRKISVGCSTPNHFLGLSKSVFPSSESILIVSNLNNDITGYGDKKILRRF